MTPVPGTTPSGAAAAWPAHHRIGSFEFLAVLRAGDTGIVYQGWDHALERPVLLEEFLPPALAQRSADGRVLPVVPAAAPVLARAKRLFVDESRVLAHADHPALARVLHLVHTAETAFRVMPAYDGEPLADRLARGDAPRGDAALRRLLADLLDGLEAWHALAGAHGGVRASQVICLAHGHALLLGPDAASRTPLGGQDVEALGARPGGAASALGDDLHALAGLLRQCLLGAPERDPGLPLMAALGQAQQRGEAVAANDDRLLRALEAALSPDPSRRPASVAQLRAWLQHGSTAAANATVSAVAPAVSPRIPGGAPPPLPTPPTAALAAPSQSPARPPMRAPLAGPTPGPIPGPMPAPVPAPGAVKAGAAARSSLAPDEEEEVDAVTSALIRSVVDAIPDRPPRPGPTGGASAARPAPSRYAWPPAFEPGPGAAAARVEPALARDEPSFEWPPSSRSDDVAAAAPDGPPPRRGRSARLVVWGLAGLIGLGAIAFALSQQGLQRPPEAAQAPARPAPADVPRAATPVPPLTTEAAGPALSAATPPVDAAAAPGGAAADPAASTETAPPAAVASSPRQQCGQRTEFALYRCMQQQCAQGRWSRHPQCVEWRRSEQAPG